MFLRARPGMPYSSASQTEDQIVVVVVVVVFWPCHEACRVLVPQPGIEPMPPAVEAWSLNHWTAREVWGPGFLRSLIHHRPILLLKCNKNELPEQGNAAWMQRQCQTAVKVPNCLLFFFFFGCVGSSLLRGLSLVVVSWGYSLLRCTGFLLRWLLLLWSTGSRYAGFNSCGAQA